MRTLDVTYYKCVLLGLQPCLTYSSHEGFSELCEDHQQDTESITDSTNIILMMNHHTATDSITIEGLTLSMGAHASSIS